jgi:hypothetical protein
MKNHTYPIVAVSTALLFASAPFVATAMSVGATDAALAESIALPMQVNVEGIVGADLKVTLTPGQMKALIQAQVEREGGGEMGGARLEVGVDGEDVDVRAMGTFRAKEVADEQSWADMGKAELHVNIKGEDVAVGASIDMHEKVHSANEFELFVHHKAKTDEHLKSVDVKDGKVDIEYEAPAKLFGFMNTALNTRVSADTSGNVTVTYPWYHIFMKKTHSKASLQSEIARAIAAERKGEKEGIASTTMQAMITTAMGIPNLFDIIADTLKDVLVKSETKATTTIAQ